MKNDGAHIRLCTLAIAENSRIVDVESRSYSRAYGSLCIPAICRVVCSTTLGAGDCAAGM